LAKKTAQEQAAKISKTHGSSTSFKSLTSKQLMIDFPRLLSAKKGAYGASTSN
jgi:hypothetical protein